MEHPWIGISGTTLNPQLNQAMNLPADQRGVLVVDVTQGSPADKASLQGSRKTVDIDGEQVKVGGDVIVGIDDQKVLKFDDLLTYLLYNAKVGQNVTLQGPARREDPGCDPHPGRPPGSVQREFRLRPTTAPDQNP